METIERNVPPRPKADIDLKTIAAREVAQLLDEEEFKDEEAISQIAKLYDYDLRDDGYNLAKKLEDRYCWDCDLNVAKTLDGMEFKVRKLLNEKVREWVKEFDVKPPFEIGTKVKFGWGKKGEVDDYDLEEAKYKIKEDGEKGKARYIVNYEDAKMLEEV